MNRIVIICYNGTELSDAAKAQIAASCYQCDHIAIDKMVEMTEEEMLSKVCSLVVSEPKTTTDVEHAAVYIQGLFGELMSNQPTLNSAMDLYFHIRKYYERTKDSKVITAMQILSTKPIDKPTSMKYCIHDAYKTIFSRLCAEL